MSATEARKLCPDLIMQHVATWKEGESSWAYHDDSVYKETKSHKVALDPYRLESRKILACIKDTLPADHHLVEKASVDEVFIDLSAQVHSILLERYPELASPAPYDDPTESLPLPPITKLDWQADALVDLDDHETEADDPDWDDVAILIGSELTRTIRATIFEKLKYTCSAGIGSNKMLAKLGSGHKKPNAQTVIRNRASQQFLADLEFTKIRMLGGKLGDKIATSFNTTKVQDLLLFSHEQLKNKLGDESGTWVHHIIRGIDHSEVNSRTDIKSMLSAKAFDPSLNDPEAALRWIRTFIADVYGRLLDEGGPEKRRPQTMTLIHLQGARSRSRRVKIPLGKTLNLETLFDMAKTLFNETVENHKGEFWPCKNLSLSISNFEDGTVANKGIGAFLMKGAEVKAWSSSTPNSGNPSKPDQARPEKRRRLDGPGLERFFKEASTVGAHEDEPRAKETRSEEQSPVVRGTLGGEVGEVATESSIHKPPNGPPRTYESFWRNHATSPAGLPNQDTSLSYEQCNLCPYIGPSPEAIQSHQDWHFAKALQDEERKVHTGPKASDSKSGPNRYTGWSRGGKSEKGQSKLNFGS